MLPALTAPSLKRAHRTAIKDFTVCGLCTDELHGVPVRLAFGGEAYGWCWNDGTIEIPSLCTSRFMEFFGEPRVPVTDVVRHELAHALAALHGDVVDGQRFKWVFGGRYDREWEERPAFDPEIFVAEHATTSPAEDFAHTVMVYTRHKGRTQRYARRPGVMERFEFVSWLAGAPRWV